MTGRIERKVAWSSVATYVASAAGLAALQAVGETELVDALPDPMEPFALALLPLCATFLAGWKARHTPRPDLGELDDEPGGHAAGPGRPPFRKKNQPADPDQHA